MAKENSTEAQTTPAEDKKTPETSEFKPGFTLGANGYMSGCEDIMGEKIPQLHALLTVLSDEEWAWNDKIKQELLHLARGLACNINEAHEESIHKQIAKSKH